MKHYQKLCAIAFLPLFVGCVSTKEYRATKAQLLGYQFTYAQMEQRADSLQRALDALGSNTELSSSRLAELENLLAQREAALFEINQILEEALSGFAGKGMSVSKRNGRVYVMLEEKLLFESGKSEVSQEGARAVKRLAQVLADNPNIDITVEGHTDNRGYIAKKDAQIVDNWDLSCKRATEVIRLMTKSTGLSPSRITASGRSQYQPISQGDTESIRAQNRRTEIILTPKFDKIWELLSESM